jgi:hypothetical protein
MEHFVRIKDGPSTGCSADPKSIDVYRERKDTITWNNETETDYRVHFAVCPLEENDFMVHAHGKKDRTGLKPDAAPGTYEYDILTSSAEVAADPNVIVH